MRHVVSLVHYPNGERVHPDFPVVQNLARRSHFVTSYQTLEMDLDETATNIMLNFCIHCQIVLYLRLMPWFVNLHVCFRIKSDKDGPSRKRRNTGSDASEFLLRKLEMDREMKEREFELRREEAERRRQDEERRREREEREEQNRRQDEVCTAFIVVVEARD